MFTVMGFTLIALVLTIATNTASPTAFIFETPHSYTNEPVRTPINIQGVELQHELAKVNHVVQDGLLGVC